MNIFRVHRDDPNVWAWMPSILDRIHAFCVKYDTETSPDDAVNIVRTWFSLNDPRLGLWGGVVDDRLVAHIFATPEPSSSDVWRYILIRQAEIDEGIDAREESPVAMNWIKDWATSLGLKKIEMLTHRSAEAMSRRWGFTPYKSLMLLELE